MDPETLLPCPYDKSHLVRAARLPYHLVKCERNNPRVARATATCPFNARHRVPRAELQSHVASCPDKCDHSFPPGTDACLGDRAKQPDIARACQKPPCQEDWEAEVEDLEDPPPFILNETPHLLLLRDHRSVPAAPTSQNRDEGASGHLLRAQEGRKRGARGPSAPLAAAAPAEKRFTHRF